MTLVVGTAGHIDHGKTTLLRALTGIDADRLPEERRRGMTIDVGYAHLDLDDGTSIDFVDVPGHDKLVGNMLVGAGEVDVAMLVVAADDGPRAQTLEHLALLDALGVAPGLAVITKIDAVEPERVAAVAAAVADLLAPTSLAGSPVLAASGVTGEGLDAVRAALDDLRAAHRPVARPPTLAIDRVFSVKGRGAVVTGTLRGGPLAPGDTLRLVPGEREVRVREIQVHGAAVDGVAGGGRTALNLAGIGVDELHRGMVLTADPLVRATDRALVTFGGAVRDRARAQAPRGNGRGGCGHRSRRARRPGLPGRDIRGDGPIGHAGRPSHRGIVSCSGVALRWRRSAGSSSMSCRPVGSRDGARRWHGSRCSGPGSRARPARLELHGAVSEGGRTVLAPDVRALAAASAVAAVKDEASLGSVRSAVAETLRRSVTIPREEATAAATPIIEDLVADGRLVRDGDVIRRPGARGADRRPGARGGHGRPRGTARRAVPAAHSGTRRGSPAARPRASEPWSARPGSSSSSRTSPTRCRRTATSLRARSRWPDASP